MKSTFLSGLRSLFAVVAGFLVIALGTTLTFTVWLGGIGFHKSGPTELALATVGALASGLAGGQQPWWPDDAPCCTPQPCWCRSPSIPEASLSDCLLSLDRYSPSWLSEIDLPSHRIR